MFEGGPIVHEGRVYIAVTRYVQNKAITAIHCYSAEMESGGPPRWVQEVVSVREETEGKPRFSHQLLTLAGPNVVLCSPRGTMAAVNALTGRPAWVVRCPEGMPPSERAAAPHDASPCLYAEGRIYAAPWGPIGCSASIRPQEKSCGNENGSRWST